MESSPFFSTASFQLILLAAFLIPAVVFLATEFSVLKRIRRENRLLQPGWVWLQIIPFAGQIWQFGVVYLIAGSIQKEWLADGEDSLLGITHEAARDLKQSKPTLAIGMAYCALNSLVVFTNLFAHLTGDTAALIAGLLALASIICWVIYWSSLASWNRRLKEKMQPGL
ncbi:MAG TPA: hypothetical protein VG605_01470 [Puia sp.]|nr:hypothetical protein [Puia sp.]